MRAFVYKRPCGRYTLTKLQPVRCRVMGSEQDDLYVEAGDPIGRIDLCELFVNAMLKTNLELKAFEGIEIEINAVPLRKMLEIQK